MEAEISCRITSIFAQTVLVVSPPFSLIVSPRTWRPCHFSESFGSFHTRARMLKASPSQVGRRPMIVFKPGSLYNHAPLLSLHVTRRSTRGDLDFHRFFDSQKLDNYQPAMHTCVSSVAQREYTMVLLSLRMLVELLTGLTWFLMSYLNLSSTS